MQCVECKKWIESGEFCSVFCRGRHKGRNSVSTRCIKCKNHAKRGQELCGVCKRRHKRVTRETKKIKTQAAQIRKFKQNKHEDFFGSREWQELRYFVIRLYGRKCMCCFVENVELHVDHIKPRSKYPDLSLDINNLQVLCRACNIGKNNYDEIDYRTEDHKCILAKAVNAPAKPHFLQKK